MSEKNKQFPHLLPHEIRLWEEFLSRHELLYQRFEYDVHVGELDERQKRLTGEWKKGAEAVYLKRIDVVGFQPDRITIFEVKPHAGLGALGQILGYLDLYQDKFDPNSELVGAIVTQFLDVNMRSLFAERGIEMYIFPDVL